MLPMPTSASGGCFNISDHEKCWGHERNLVLTRAGSGVKQAASGGLGGKMEGRTGITPMF